MAFERRLHRSALAGVGGDDVLQMLLEKATGTVLGDQRLGDGRGAEILTLAHQHHGPDELRCGDGPRNADSRCQHLRE